MLNKRESKLRLRQPRKRQLEFKQNVLQSSAKLKK